MFLHLTVARLAYFEELLNKVKEIDTSGSFDSDGFLRGRGVGPILAATSCSFKFPLTYPDEALLTSSIHVNDDVKETGFGMTYQVCVSVLNWNRIDAPTVRLPSLRALDATCRWNDHVCKCVCVPGLCVCVRARVCFANAYPRTIQLQVERQAQTPCCGWPRGSGGV